VHSDNSNNHLGNLKQIFGSFSVGWYGCEVPSTPHSFPASFWKCRFLLCSRYVNSCYCDWSMEYACVHLHVHRHTRTRTHVHARMHRFYIKYVHVYVCIIISNFQERNRSPSPSPSPCTPPLDLATLHQQVDCNEPLTSLGNWSFAHRQPVRTY
jgi:hypothetical protein